MGKNFWATVLGLAVFIFFFNLDHFFPRLGIEPMQRRFLAVFLFTVYNWLIAVLPLYVTGFIGVALASIVGAESASNLLASFAHPIVFLFLAGFLFARAMSEAGLDKRMSLFILSRKFINKSFDRLVFAIIFLGGFLSLWISNTATAAMLLPIVLGITKSLGIKDKKTVGLILLGMAYSTSVGGIGSPVGSTPNIIVIGMLEELAGISISFYQWLLLGAPLSFLFNFIVYLYIKRQIPHDQKKVDSEYIQQELSKLAPISSREKWLIGLFITLVFCWFAPGFLSELLGKSYPILSLINERLNPGMTGIFLASFLFIFPLAAPKKLLDPQDIKRIDWPSLLLFGSGLALGKTMFSTGLAQIAGDLLVGNVLGSGYFLIILALSIFTIFATELVSNTATANILIPIVIAAAAPLGVSPALPAIAVALSCSLAFMLPVATPPNAIVYGSGAIDVPMMVKFGLLLNFVFGLIIACLFYLLKFIS